MNSRKPDAAGDPLGALIRASLSAYVARARPSPHLRPRLLASARVVGPAARLSARRPGWTRWNWLVRPARLTNSVDWITLLKIASLRTVEIHLPLLRLVS